MAKKKDKDRGKLTHKERDPGPDGKESKALWDAKRRGLYLMISGPRTGRQYTYFDAASGKEVARYYPGSRRLYLAGVDGALMDSSLERAIELVKDHSRVMNGKSPKYRNISQ